MASKPKSAQQRFADLVDALGCLDGVSAPVDEPGREGRFGGAALKVHGKIFAMLVRERLVVKLPRSRVDVLVDAGEGIRFDAGRGRPMREWLSLDPGARVGWQDLAGEALAFADRSPA
ncbi:hypothetical protein QMK19_31465 [Streptomyces sp. H10-C2]|uniref:hypothetical protein n=1 Tax=unclassified Streptomyces TaxID=2593676 RepID=UPI0024BACFF5|nr:MULTISPECIES: hypothetical protein [unclassified Streptomyces]MDJ0346088.1 hypothetical protein [Streptomyces sp. PH10-H1]MDJ0374039.1 hypothetical protein [Streptomyces sp. H10-C2]